MWYATEKQKNLHIWQAENIIICRFCLKNYLNNWLIDLLSRSIVFLSLQLYIFLAASVNNAPAALVDHNYNDRIQVSHTKLQAKQ